MAAHQYNGFSLFGVPYNEKDIGKAAEQLLHLYDPQGKATSDAIGLILQQNERVVSRCGMLVSFSGIVIALFLFTANNAVLSEFWQKWVYYSGMLIWVVSIMLLLWSLRHKLPPISEVHTRHDFVFTAELFLKRMGYYNIALIATIVSFISLVVVLQPISVTVTDNLFPTSTAKSKTPSLSAPAGKP